MQFQNSHASFLVFGAFFFSSVALAQSPDITSSTTLDDHYIVYIAEGSNFQNTGPASIGTVPSAITRASVDGCGGSTNNLQGSNRGSNTVGIEIFQSTAIPFFN